MSSNSVVRYHKTVDIGSRIPQEPANANTVYNQHGGKNSFMHKKGLDYTDAYDRQYALQMARNEAKSYNEQAEAQRARTNQHIDHLQSALHKEVTNRLLIYGGSAKGYYTGPGGKQWEIDVNVRPVDNRTATQHRGLPAVYRNVNDRYLTQN